MLFALNPSIPFPTGTTPDTLPHSVISRLGLLGRVCKQEDILASPTPRPFAHLARCRHEESNKVACSRHEPISGSRKAKRVRLCEKGIDCGVGGLNALNLKRLAPLLQQAVGWRCHPRSWSMRCTKTLPSLLGVTKIAKRLIVHRPVLCPPFSTPRIHSSSLILDVFIASRLHWARTWVASHLQYFPRTMYCGKGSRFVAKISILKYLSTCRTKPVSIPATKLPALVNKTCIKWSRSSFHRQTLVPLVLLY